MLLMLKKLQVQNKMELFKDLLGVKYKDNGRSKEGCDCYGLAIEVLKRLGIKLEDFINNPIEKKLDLKPIQNPEIGCIIWFRKSNVSHIAVYIGEGLLIHAKRDFGVCIEPLYKYESFVKEYTKVS